MKRCIVLLLFFLASVSSKAQQYALFNTKTVFDAFENPAQKAFTLDSSRQYVSNFLIPYFGFKGLNKGPSEFGYKKIFGETTSGKLIQPLLPEHTNVYLLTYRIFKHWKYQKELGFSWQIRSEAFNDDDNKSLATYNSYRTGITPYTDLYNSLGEQQSYHQFSLTYRENLDKKIAFGAKVSLLSGIAYNKVDLGGSEVLINPDNNKPFLPLTGTYKGTFTKTEDIGPNTFLPFKNPGLSVSLGTTVTFKNGFFLMANLKDLGFIKWGKKKSFVTNFNTFVDIDEITNPANPVEQKPLKELGTTTSESFTSKTNTKVDFLLAKTFSFYKPSLILSKSVFNKDGDIALVNTFAFSEYSLSGTPTYNLRDGFAFGLQTMYQTPNFEVFLGTDNINDTYSAAKAALKNTGITEDFHGGSVYFGVAIKFGYVVEHPMNMSFMPKIDNIEGQSIFKRMFSIFKKKPKK